MNLDNISQFLSSGTIAVVAVSQTKSKTGNYIYLELKKKGFPVIPVSANMKTFDGDSCFASVKDLPAEVKAIVVVTKPESTESIVRDAIDKGIKQIFIQQGAQSEEAVKFAKAHGANIITQKCILMFANPGGIHKLHGFIAKLFNKYPK